MTLFNYSKCEYCENKMNKNKVELSKLFPTNVCNKICDYNVTCNKCNRTPFTLVSDSQNECKMDEVRYKDMLQSTERRRPVSGLLVKCCKLKPSQHNVPVSGK